MSLVSSVFTNEAEKAVPICLGNPFEGIYDTDNYWS